MHFCRFRPGFCAFLDHCGRGPASCHHPGRRVSKGWGDAGGRRREIRKGLEILGRGWPPEWGDTGPRRRLGRVEAGVRVTRPFPQLVSAFQGSQRFLLSFFRRRQRRLKAKSREGAVVTSGGPKGGSRNGYLALLCSDSQRPEDSLIRFYPIPLRPYSLGGDSDLPALCPPVFQPEV